MVLKLQVLINLRDIRTLRRIEGYQYLLPWELVEEGKALNSFS